MSIIKQYHKDTNTTYVYESEYYYDKEKKQSRSKRKLIGKIDEETGQIVPTGKRGGGRKKASKAASEPSPEPGIKDVDEPGDLQNLKDLHNLKKRVGDQEEEIISLKSHMADMEELYKGLLAQKDGAVKDLQSQVKDLKAQVQKYERAISGITLSLEKLNGS